MTDIIWRGKRTDFLIESIFKCFLWLKCLCDILLILLISLFKFFLTMSFFFAKRLICLKRKNDQIKYNRHSKDIYYVIKIRLKKWLKPSFIIFGQIEVCHKNGKNIKILKKIFWPNECPKFKRKLQKNEKFFSVSHELRMCKDGFHTVRATITVLLLSYPDLGLLT